WNFLSRDEKLSWFTKMANIYTVDQKYYLDGDENTRYVSGNYATEFCIRMQGYNKNITDLAGGTRKQIMDKYNESLELNGRSNIPVCFVSRVRFDDNGNALGAHGMNALLIGNNPLEFNDWIWYEPQGNILVNPGDWTGSIPFNSRISIYKLENFGGELAWGDDMPSTFLGSPVTVENSTQLITFKIDSNGASSVDVFSPNLLTTKPTVGVEDENTSIPVGFYLAQNYPNPFNSNTTIQFDIPLNPPSKGDNNVVETLHATSLQLLVYDITGKEITTLVDNVNTSGSYSVEWNATGYPSGIYFYQLQSNSDVIATRKMLLLR
ncbi:T9SS type A sorting domain-containing protein, partial [bacterium]|nr:T9SS type A sorting domain-containing protein [bacterium]